MSVHIYHKNLCRNACYLALQMVRYGGLVVGSATQGSEQSVRWCSSLRVIKMILLNFLNLIRFL